MGHSGRPSQELRVRAGRREAVDVFGVFWFFFFCLIGSWLEEAFRPARAPERFATELPAFSLAGARAGGSSRPRKAP